MSTFRELVQKNIREKLAESSEKVIVDKIKVEILDAISEGKCNVEVQFDTPLDSDGVSKLRALCYLELGFDIPDMDSFSVNINFRHFF